MRTSKGQLVDTSETNTVRITNLLRGRILDGGFEPMERLQEEALAKQYDTSRTPIRTALGTLAAEGLLTHRPNAGFTVGQFSRRDIDDAYETRSTLEGLACRLVAERGITPDEARRLEGCLAICDNFLKKPSFTRDELDQYYTYSNEFHDIIIEATRNKYLIRSIQFTLNIPFLGGSSTGAMFKEQVVMQLRNYVNLDRLKVAYVGQRGIFEAISARQGSRAEALMKELVLWGRASYLEKAQRFIDSSNPGHES